MISSRATMAVDERFDLVVVGGGIVGLAHAWLASERGWKVAVLERSPRAVGASIRNFGMIWPIGQAPGRGLMLALRSRQTWERVAREAGLWTDGIGSLHLAYHADECAVIEEFAAGAASHGYVVGMLTPAEVAAISPAARTEGLLAGLLSTTEMCVDPRRAIPGIIARLRERGVIVQSGCDVVQVLSGEATCADGSCWRGKHVLVCSGEDVRGLFPEAYAKVTLCKLQMMRTEPQPQKWRLGPMLAAGSTLRHYASFRNCSSLSLVQARFARERPEFDRFGIHVMVSQASNGQLTIGDSHEYADGFDPFLRDDIDRLILEYLSMFVRMPEPRIAERWYGVYAKCTDGEIALVASPMAGVWIVNALGGAGMTLSFGLAEETLARLDDSGQP